MPSIKTKKEYTVDEVLAELKKTDLPEPYKYQGAFGAPVLYIPGKSTNDIQVAVSKNKISLYDVARPKDALASVAKDIAIDALTGGWSSLFGNPNRKLMKSVEAECQRLFG